MTRSTGLFGAAFAFAALIGVASVVAGLGDEGHPVGRACVAPVDIAPAMVKADCFRFRLDRRRLIPKFAAYQLSATAAATAGSLSTGSTRSRINLTSTAARKVALAPVDEQKAVVEFLDRETARIDTLIAEKERLIELLYERRNAIITHAVTKGFDPIMPMKAAGAEWLGDIPAHWHVRRLKDLSGFVTSGSRAWAAYYTDEGSLFLRIGNLRSASIDLDLSVVQHVAPPLGAEGERTRVHGGDLLISITALIGAVGVVPEGTPTAFVNQHLALVRPSGDRVEPRWLAYCVLSRVGQEQFRSALYGGTKDGLNLDDIRSLIVLMPPQEEQRDIVKALDKSGRQVDLLLAKIRSAIGRLKEYRVTLVFAAVTGKIDVRGEAA
jgi:type I restriction enzyme S subunit